jgi:hypothetical protein
MAQPTKPTKETQRAEEADARKKASADRPPTAEEERAAPTSVDAEVRRHEEEMLERGVNQEGEGRID